MKTLKLNQEQERLFSVIFSFAVLCVGIFGYMYDNYTDPDNPLVPNLLNIILGFDLIPDEEPMFIENYYIKNQSMNPIYVDGHYRVVFDVSKQKDNKVSGIWLYMLMCFTPLFIIGLTGVKIEKIDKKKIRKLLNEFKNPHTT